MLPHRFRLSFLTLGLALAALGGGHADAKTPFDGAWAVTIMTTTGTCDPAYRYAVTVNNGNIVNDMRESSGVVAVSGKVDDSGQVRVSLRRGEQQASGRGKLSGSSGSGTWTGKSSTAGCSGRWEARRN